jgi:FkbM family methyltransferase|tara:strand:- start:214 stop:1146 length:933 start_codon:yes stop_codon:yes gene_type:complete
VRKIKLNRSNLITRLFQRYLKNRDIKSLRGNFYYYLLFRFCRKFLNNYIEIKVGNFKIFASYNKNKTSYFLLKKCQFGDDHELKTLEKFSKLNKIFLLDCGANYGFYSFYTSSLSIENKVIAFEASINTAKEFQANLELNDFKNIKLENLAVSSKENELLSFNESIRDWESSLIDNSFSNSNPKKIKTTKIDYILKNQNLNQYYIFIKLDIEGNEFDAIRGSLETIKKYSPLIIIEFSKYNLDNKTDNLDFLDFFLENFDYSIYSTSNQKVKSNDIIDLLKSLDESHQTIGNYYLIKNNSKIESIFLNNE